MQAFENFVDLVSYARLKELAERPYDLTLPEALTAERIAKFVAEGAGFRMLFATERVDDEVVEALGRLASEAKVIEKMERMQNGEVMNYIEGFASENRAVLHTALRDFFDHPATSKAAIQAAEMARSEVEKIRLFEKEMAPFTDFVLIGIGGSELGPKSNFFALESYCKAGKRVHFVGNVDPDDIHAVLKGLDLKKTLVAIVSKSGTTQETLTNEAVVRLRYKEAGLDAKSHLVTVTGEGSPLDNSKIYRACFYMWDWVGGRFSGTSASAGLIFTFAFGFEIYWSFLKGAHAMDRLALDPDLSHNLPLLGALLSIWNRNFLGHPTLAIIPYARGLSRLPAHVQQVEMESNGKRIDRRGEAVDFETAPIFWGEPGTNAQHSFFQMIHQGTNVVPVEFIGFKESQMGQDLVQEGVSSQDKLLANLFAQAVALAKGQPNSNPNKVFTGNRPSHILLGRQLTPELAGALFAYYEHKVVFQGFIWNINSFDQEGVQLGKVLANQFLEAIRLKHEKSSLGGANKIQEAYLTQLDKLT